MKFSDAILLGSTLSRQGFGGDSLVANERCALGAAHQALGMPERTKFYVHECYSDLRTAFPFLNNWQGCPLCERKDDAIAIIWHLNDSHNLSREQIAGWVATVEPKEEVLPVGEYCDVHQEAVR